MPYVSATGLTAEQAAKLDKLPADPLGGGWANYINGNQTPILIPGGVETKLTLDASTGAIIDAYLPEGVTSLWDSATSQFDFSQLSVGDEVLIRLDGQLETTTINDSFLVRFVGAVGSASEFVLPFASGNRFIPADGPVSRFNAVFIGSQDLIDFPSEIRALASDDASGYLIDIYVSVRQVTAGP